MRNGNGNGQPGYDEVEAAISKLKPADFAPKGNAERIGKAAELISQSVRQTVADVSRAGFKSLDELGDELAQMRKGWEAFSTQLEDIGRAHAAALDAFHSQMRTAAEALERLKQPFLPVPVTEPAVAVTAIDQP